MKRVGSIVNLYELATSICNQLGFMLILVKIGAVKVKHTCSSKRLKFIFNNSQTFLTMITPRRVIVSSPFDHIV